ncbi:MAG: glycosyltransferase family 9 protein [Opitutales bacterium]
MKRILVLRGGALGDGLVTFPALQALRRRGPDAMIDLVGHVQVGALAVAAGLVNRVESQHGAVWGQLYGTNLAPEFRARLRDYELVVNFWPDPSAEIARHFPLRAGQEYRWAPPLPGRGPAAAHFLAALETLELAEPELVYPLRSPHPAPGVIAIHPGSGSPAKNWSPARWRELSTWLQREFQACLRIVRGEAEPAGLLAEFGEAWAHLPLPRLADQLAGCQLFIGHDSGISHLAAACGCRGVLLFGPTDPAIWAPPTPRMKVLRDGPTLDAISVAAVQDAVRAALRDRT